MKKIFLAIPLLFAMGLSHAALTIHKGKLISHEENIPKGAKVSFADKNVDIKIPPPVLSKLKEVQTKHDIGLHTRILTLVEPTGIGGDIAVIGVSETHIINYSDTARTYTVKTQISDIYQDIHYTTTDTIALEGHGYFHLTRQPDATFTAIPLNYYVISTIVQEKNSDTVFSAKDYRIVDLVNKN